ncbi:hypothetical protein V8E55_009437 [Tylopilus felleus]
MHSDIGRRLITSITEDVMAGRLPNFNFRHISPELQNAIRSFISDEDVLQILDTVKRVEEYAKGSDQNHLWSGLLLLRGLLTSNILVFALSERRWRVDYGHALQARKEWYLARSSPTPFMLAVPYRVMDVPAPNTQFGHPDLTITLMCLSYYYSGLSNEQLKVSFEILVRVSAGVPSRTQRNQLEVIGTLGHRHIPALRLEHSSYRFLPRKSGVPKRSEKKKEFPWKMSASSWDLGERRTKLITEGKPNARVLAYLLRPENSSYMVAHKSDERWITRAFLRLVATQQPKIQALLDVGSQILDLSNVQVAKAWLEIARDAAGAIYFDDADELMVLTRNGFISPLSSSALSQQLSRCVVYLDHAHTRDTDIKFPVGSRAAVTLGPKVTKDALVQGCMRMRKLGHGHSVMFFALPKVDWSICAASSKTDPNISAQQGTSHKPRSDTWNRFCSNTGSSTVKQLADAWLKPEQKSLEDLYASRETQATQSDLSALDPGIRQQCKVLGVLSLPSAQMDEEQEREVHRERDVELPPKAEPSSSVLLGGSKRGLETAEISDVDVLGPPQKRPRTGLQ